MTALRWVLAGALVLAAGVALAAGWRTLDQDIEVVQITGDLSAAERERAAELISRQLPAGVLSLSVKAMRADLQAESWVDELGIWRQWPDAVRVDIVPQEAVARWREQALLSNRGQVIHPIEPMDDSGLPHLLGPEGAEVRVMALFQQVNARVRPHGLSVQRLEMSPDRTLRAELAGGARLIVNEADLPAQLRRLEQLLQSSLNERLEQVARLDTRYDNGVAVGWRSSVAGTSGSQHLAKGF